MTKAAYTFEIIDKDRTSLCVVGEFEAIAGQTEDAVALNWAYFWLGYYRADALKVYRGAHASEGPGPEADPMAELVPPEWTRER